MSSKQVTGEKFSLSPLPKTARGFGIHIDGTLANNKRLIYTNGRFVIIRSLDDQFDCSVFSGHTCNVNVAKFSPNGNWVASGDCEGTVMVWGVNNQSIKNTVRANMGVLDIAWGADNSQLAAVGNGGNGLFARVFRMDSTNSIGEISAHSKKILSCALRPTKPFFLATCSEDLAINFYKGVPYQHFKTHRLNKNFPNCVRYNKSGDKLAIVSSDKQIIFFSGEGELLHTIKQNSPDAHKGSIYSCCFSPDGRRLLTSSGDKTIKIWDAETYKCEKTFSAGNGVGDMQVACIWMDEYLISVSLSGQINFWDEFSTEKSLKTIWSGHQTGIYSIASCESESLVFSSDKSGKIVRWDFENKTSKYFADGTHKENPINGIVINSSGDKMYSTGFDDKLFSIDVSSGESTELCSLNGQPKGIALGAKSNSLIIVATSKNILCVRNLKDNQCNPQQIKYTPTCVAICPSEKCVAVGGINHKVTIYEINGTELKQIHEISKHKAEITVVSYTEDGKYLVSASRDCKIYVWPTDSDYSKPLNSRGWGFHASKVTSCCVQKGVNNVATGSLDETIIVWNEITKGNTAKRRIISPAHISGVSVLHTYNEKTFLSSGEDRCIRLWEF